MKLWIGTLLILISLFTPQVRAEDDEASDFADGKGREVLLHVTDRLATQLTLLPDGIFPVVPSDWNRERIAAVVLKIKMLPDEKRQRAHRSLMFDHDVKSQSLLALEPFFVVYGLVPDGKDISREQLRDLERRLLQETAGLWKASPKDAEKFATAVLALFDRDVIFCKGEVKMSSAIEYHFVVNPTWMEGGVLVTSPTWAINPDAPSYKDMQEHGSNSELYRSFMSRGLGENGVVSIEHTVTPAPTMKINFRLTKINYQTDTGKGEFVDIDTKSHPVECHNLLVDAEMAKEKATAPAKASQAPASGSALSSASTAVKTKTTADAKPAVEDAKKPTLPAPEGSKAAATPTPKSL